MNQWSMTSIFDDVKHWQNKIGDRKWNGRFPGLYRPRGSVISLHSDCSTHSNIRSYN